MVGISWFEAPLPDQSLSTKREGGEGRVIIIEGKLFVKSQAPQAQNTWCMRQLMYIENCMGKSLIVKKIV